MNISLFLSSLGGGPLKTTNKSCKDFNGGTPITDSLLCTSSAIGKVWNGGLQYTPDGKLCVTTQLNMKIKSYTRGLPIGPNHRIICSVNTPIVDYQRGIPFDSDGRVVLAEAPTLLEGEVEDAE